MHRRSPSSFLRICNANTHIFVFSSPFFLSSALVGQSKPNYPQLISNRCRDPLSACRSRSSFSTSSPKSSDSDEVVIYEGPMTKIVKVMKYTSLFTSAMVLLSIPSLSVLVPAKKLVSLLTAQFILAGFSLGTTTLIHWLVSTYVVKAVLLPADPVAPSQELMRITSLNFWVRPKHTLVALNAHSFAPATRPMSSATLTDNTGRSRNFYFYGSDIKSSSLKALLEDCRQQLAGPRVDPDEEQEKRRQAEARKTAAAQEAAKHK
eukprot:g32562.t1